MTLGTEEFIQKVQHVKNEFNAEGDLVKPTTRYFTMNERVGREKELQEYDSILNLTPRELTSINMTPQRLGDLRRRRKNLSKELIANSPPTDLSGAEKDALYKLEKELAEKIQVGMLPQEAMRRAPVGAVDTNVRWLKATKSFQLAWKNVRRLLNPDSEDSDLANIEQLRPSIFRPGHPSTFMGDAQIPGHMAYSDIPDENWEAAGLPLVTEGSPLAQAEKRERENGNGDGAWDKVQETLKMKDEEIERLKALVEGKNARKAEIRENRVAAMAKARAARKTKKQVAAEGSL